MRSTLSATKRRSSTEASGAGVRVVT